MASVSAQLAHVSVQLAHVNARLPQRATDGAVGYDLHSCESVVVPARGRALVDTGVCLAFAPEAGFYARIAPRSGLALRGIDAAAGVCDADYRGTYRVLLSNCTDSDHRVEVGDRVAQLVFERAERPVLQLVEQLPETLRAEGGFGSTGDGERVCAQNDLKV